MARGEKNDKSRQLPPWWGALAVIIGIVCLVGAISLLLAEGDASWRDQRTISRGLVLGAALVALGLFSLVGNRGEKRANSTARPSDGRPPAPAAATPTPSGDSAPRPRAELEGMLQHSNDVLATLRDLVLHGQDQPGMVDVRALLARSGLMEWEGASVVLANRLRHNGRWWLSTGKTELDGEDLERLVSIEAALNVGEDLSSRGMRGDLDRRVRAALKVVDLRPRSGTSEDVVNYLLEGAEPRGEWARRIRFADDVESLPAPLRVEFDFQTNVRAGVMVVDFCAASPTSLSFASATPEGRTELARSYTLWLALALANLALRPSEGTTRAIVNARTRSWDETVLSLELDPEALRRLADAARSMGATLPSDPALRASVGPDGSLQPVEPFMCADDETVCPHERFREVELDESPCPQSVARACGARLVRDLGIMEKAGRVAAWNEMVPRLGDTTQEAVSVLMATRDTARDVTVAEACERASKALVDGTLDVADRRSLAQLFVDGGTLAVVSRKASAALEQDPTPEQLAAIVGDLEAVLSPIAEMGAYLDDEGSAYRYFNSVAERITYNRRVEDERTVRLVPDEYYSAHFLASRALTMLGRHEEALAHADELMRIAPLTPDAALAKVRCLEEQSRIFEAADLLKQAIGFSSTVRDMAICFYRLAFMEWKLGRNDLAVACYQRSIALHQDVARNAQEELDDLIETNEGLTTLPADKVTDALEAAGLPAGRLDALRDQTRDALVACADAEIFSIARQFASAMAGFDRDDALISARRSLMPQ